MANVITKTVCNHSIFVASPPEGRAYYGLNYQATKLSLHGITPYQVRHVKTL